METTSNYTPLHYAAQKGDLKEIHLLLDAGADINSTHCDFKNTPLLVACWFGHSDCVKALINRGAKLDIPNIYGSTPVHIAARQNEAKCLRILLDNNAPYNSKNNTGSGNTPLFLAAQAGSRECLQLLLNHIKFHTLYNPQKDIDCKGSGDNFTPIQIAAVREHVQCYWDLVAAGADYKKEIEFDNSKKSIGEMIATTNLPFRYFVLKLEYDGKHNPERYYGSPFTYCFLCHQDFIPNDVVVTVRKCSETFHANCFENYSLRYFIKQNENIPWMIEFKKDTSDKEFEHLIKTNNLGAIPLADQCPHCNGQIDPQKSLKFGVFLRKSWEKIHCT